MTKKHLEGSLSIEAALIMPLILGVIVLALYLAIFMHDKMVLEYSLVRAGSKCNDYIMGKEIDSENAIDQINDVLEENINHGLIGKWNAELKTTRENDYIEMELDGRMNNSQGIFNDLINNQLFGIKVFCKEKLINECEWIRKG